MIVQFIGENQRHWYWLPELSLPFNTAVSEGTGYSNAYIIYGREPRLPKTLI